MCLRLFDAKRAQHSVCLLWGTLGVSRAGYDAWKDRPVSPRRRRDDELSALIARAATAGRASTLSCATAACASRARASPG
jgi:hypothetical protein